MNLKHVFSTLILVSLFLSCSKEKQKSSVFRLIGPEESGITFRNIIQENDSVNVLEFVNIYTGGGVAAGDLNNDGLPDLFFTGNMVSSRLYVNRSTKDNLRFQDITELSGVTTDQWMTGVTMVDINQDGLLDIYVCSSGNKEDIKRANKLFVNQGIIDGIPHFKEAAQEYGIADLSYATQAAFFDYDNDGDLDLFIISNYSENYIGSSVNVPKKKIPEYDVVKSDKLYKNNYSEKVKEGKSDLPYFTEVTKEAGILTSGYSLGLAVSDINHDGWADLYIANDFISNDILYINNGDGTFTNRASEYLKHTSYASMGVDIADFNNDSNADIGVVDMIPEDNLRMKSMLSAGNYEKFKLDIRNGYEPQFSRNTLQINSGINYKGEYSFSEIGRLAGIHHTDWSWSFLFVDFDNDGWKDIFITNGFKRDLQDLDFVRYFDQPQIFSSLSDSKAEFIKMAHQLPGVKVPNYFFRNKGNLSFENMTSSWGLEQRSYSNGAVYTDLDNDGDLELVIHNVDDFPFIYNNILVSEDDGPNYIKIDFKGLPGNLQGIGAKVWVKTKDNIQYLENYPTRGYQSSINSEIHVGLGTFKIIDEIKVTWPDGKTESFFNVDSNQKLSVDYKNAKEEFSPAKKTELILKESGNEFNLKYKHQEYDYVDFHYQRLIPFKLSQNGPGIAVGDINNDGLDDFFIGGSRFNPGTFHIQTEDERFNAHSLQEDNKFEDQGVLLFDAEGDGDLDLYAVSGSVEMGVESRYYQDRLYINDGSGKFTPLPEALPEFQISGSCVVAADFDKDGDMDLFIGGRSIPGKYPLPASSKLLINVSDEEHGPRFIDGTDEYLPFLNKIGMVTAALWSDYNNDGWVDLFLVGEGMYIQIFENFNGNFKDQSTKITNNSTGFWNSIISADFDGDGYMDYVIGNLGLNTLLKASKEKPVKIYAKDFDNNGSLDPLLFHYLLGEMVLFPSRDEFVDQLPGMKTRFPKYSDYASITADNLFQDGELDDAYNYTLENLESGYLKNSKGEKLELEPLPVEAQFSPAYGMLAQDFDGDGINDLILAGNSFAPSITLGWNDASKGTFLKGLGNGKFKPLKGEESGLYSDKDVKSVAQLVTARNEPLVILTNNNDSLDIYKYKKSAFSIISLNHLDAWAKIIYIDEKQEKVEFNYGSGYLSQNSRKYIISDKVKTITIYDYSGRGRTINPNPPILSKK